MTPHASHATIRIRLTVGPHAFAGRLETQTAPRSTALLMELMPLDGSVVHARWSGEAVWLPLHRRHRVPPENPVAFPQPGQLLLYAGARSEPELLIPYGACAFACKAGQLAGNHVVTLDDAGGLRDLGETVLQQGAQPLRMTVELPPRSDTWPRP